MYATRLYHSRRCQQLHRQHPPLRTRQLSCFRPRAACRTRPGRSTLPVGASHFLNLLRRTLLSRHYVRDHLSRQLIVTDHGLRKDEVDVFQRLAGCLPHVSHRPLRNHHICSAGRTSGHMNHTNGMAAAQDSVIHIQIFQPTFCNAMPPAKTVMKEKSHSPNAPAAAPVCRSFNGVI